MADYDEPFGHRGRPTYGEEMRARRVAERLGACIRQLQDTGFNHDEAIGFIAGAAYEEARRLGEGWSSPVNTKLTIDGLLSGKAAKTWSLDALELAIVEVNTLLKEGEDQ